MTDPALLVEADQLARLGDHRLRIEREVGVNLGRDAAGDDRGELGAEIDGDAVGDVADRRARLAAPVDRLFDEPGVGWELGGLEDQRRVGGRVGRAELADRLHVAGIGDDGRHGAELVELAGHGGLQGQ